MHTRSDLFILFVASFLIGGLAALTWSKHINTEQVLIQTAQETLVLDLSQSGSYKLTSGTGHSLLEIHEKQVRFSESTCTHKICVKHGWLSRFKPMTVCIPNQISAQLIEQNNKKFDAYSF